MHDNRIKAHIRKGDNGEEIQKLLEHLEQAAIYASDALQRKYFQACVQLFMTWVRQQWIIRGISRKRLTEKRWFAVL